MRPPRRFLPLFSAIFLCLAIAARGGVCLAQAPQQTQAGVQAAQQADGALPTKWNEALRALAEKIASEAHPQRAIALDLKNISSLDAQDVTRIRLALESELKQRQFRILSSDSAGSHAQVTLSESKETYIWVAKVQRGQSDEREPQVVIVGVEKVVDGPSGKNTGSLSLSEKLVWEQGAKILDFATIGNSPESLSRLLVLEPERLIFYHGEGAGWEMERIVPIPHSAPWPRDVSGWIDTGKGRAYIRGIICDGDFFQPESVRCEPSDPTHDTRPELRLRIPDREGVDTATLGPICGEARAVLATGTGDWTQPDPIQGYVSADSQVAVSGAPIEMDGPVLALYPTGALGSARAVVRSLKTGNYEAYLVTATCSH